MAGEPARASPACGVSSRPLVLSGGQLLEVRKLRIGERRSDAVAPHSVGRSTRPFRTASGSPGFSFQSLTSSHYFHCTSENVSLARKGEHHAPSDRILRPRLDHGTACRSSAPRPPRLLRGPRPRDRGRFCRSRHEWREGPQARLADARRRGFDVLACAKLDRRARSVHYLTSLGRELEALGIDLVVLDQPIDTSALPRAGFLFTSWAALRSLSAT